jgi:hypothetical protein
VPDVFCLLMGNDGKARRFCRVVWRRGGQLGVAFIDEAAADLDLDAPRRRHQRRPATAPSPSSPPSPPSARPPAARPLDAGALVLPGCGPRAAIVREPRAFALSSVALGMVVLLAAATAVLALAGQQGAADAAWAVELCATAGNLCGHPEWPIAAAAVMSVVYLAVKGMEL